MMMNVIGLHLKQHKTAVIRLSQQIWQDEKQQLLLH